MANAIVRITDTDPNGEKSVMSKITVTTAGLLSLAEIPKEDSYILRLWIKANGVKNVSAYIGRNPYLLSVNTAWKQFKNTGTATANSTCDLYLPTGTYYIWHPMLERSTKASDYRQAPEDVQENINTAANDAVESANAYTNEVLKEYSTTEEMRSEIQQTQEMISLSVSKQTTRSMTYAQTQANNALTAAKADTDNKLKSYVTTTKHSADITLISHNITAAVTKTDTLAEYVDGDFYNQITNEYKSAISVSADGIESRVQKTYATITTVNGIATRVTTAESNITQNANSISSLVKTVNGHTSSITQNANAIKLRVETSKLVSEINASSGTIHMKSNRFTVDSTNFKLTANGTITASNVILDGSLKTKAADGTFYNHIHGGVIETFWDDKRIAYIEPVFNKAQNICQYAILGSGNYDGVAIGGIWDNSLQTYYRCNINNAETVEGCRHHFIGDVRFDSGKFKSNINFESNYGLSWGGNIGLRYANSGVSRTGVWLGIQDCPTILTGSEIRTDVPFYIDGGLRGTWNGQSVTVFTYDAGREAVNVGANTEKLYLKGTNIYANNSSISTSSDERVKENIEQLNERYLTFIKSVTPVRFNYKDGTSGRTHTGFIAQNVLKAMEQAGISTTELAAFVDLNGDGTEYALRYEEFISPLLLYIRHLEHRIEKLEN